MKGWNLIPALAVILIISGCITQQGEDLVALAPHVDIEATVVSLSLDESGNYYEGEELTSAPGDTAVIRIDKITEIDQESFWNSVGLGEGNEFTVGFSYTARPAKIITVVGDTTYSGETVTHTIVPTEITFENGYFVFKENGNSETETTLPGLEEGSKFKTRLWQFTRTYNRAIEDKIAVGKYEIIS